MVSCDQRLPLRKGLGNSKFLAGLVRRYSTAGRFDSGVDGRLVDRGSLRSFGRDLRERSGGARRKEPDQTLHRIYLRDSIGRARFFRHRRSGRGGASSFARFVHELGAIFPDQRALECFHRRLLARAHGRANHFHARRGCAAQRAARFQGSFLCARRQSAADHCACARSGVALRNYLRHLARTRPRHRRNDGGAAYAREIASRFRISPRGSAHSFSPSIP